MIKPINGHLLIEPEVHESFVGSEKETYEEIGNVIAQSDDIQQDRFIGSKVYFDSWLAAKYPKRDSDGDFFWLVKLEDIRAIEHVE